jgi:hypothetical protein
LSSQWVTDRPSQGVYLVRGIDGGTASLVIRKKFGWPHRIRKGCDTGPDREFIIIGKNIGLAAYRLRVVGILAVV